MNRKVIATQIVSKLKIQFPNQDCDLVLDNPLSRPMRAPVAHLVHYEAAEYGTPKPHVQRVKLFYEVITRAHRINGDGDVLDLLDAVRDTLYLHRIEYYGSSEDVDSRLVLVRDNFLEEKDKIWSYSTLFSVECLYAGTQA